MPKLTCDNLAILLSGKSLNDLASAIQELRDAEPITCAAINRKAHIEKNVLGPINRKIEVWCILNPQEFLHEIENVREFLREDRENLLLTSSSALGSAIELIRYRPLPGYEKILLLDDWLYAIYGLYYGRHKRPLKSLFDLTGEISTLFILLHFVASCEFYENVYLFGCDGALPAESALDSELYFMQESYETERLKASAIYRDMAVFEAEWGRSVEALLADRGIQMPVIINANLASHYTVFERRAVQEVVAEMKSLPASGELSLYGYGSWRDLIDKVSGELALHRLISIISLIDTKSERESGALELLQEIRQECSAIRSDVLLNETRQQSAPIGAQFVSLRWRRVVETLRDRLFRLARRLR